MTLMGKKTGSPGRAKVGTVLHKQSNKSTGSTPTKKITIPSAKAVSYQDGPTAMAKDEQLRDDLQSTYLVRFFSFVIYVSCFVRSEQLRMVHIIYLVLSIQYLPLRSRYLHFFSKF